MNPLPNQILVVDDEAPSREFLASMISSVDSSFQIEQAQNAEEALHYALNNHIDIAFLDIDLPGLNGLVLAENLLTLKNAPIIIFATGSPDHAVRGFELQVVDYLLKPFHIDRVAKALIRAQQALSQSSDRESHHSAIRKTVSHALANVGKIWAEKDNGARMLVDFEQIGWAQAKEKEVYLKTSTDEMKVRLTLNALQDKLSTGPFVRVHRTWLVNINLIREVIPWDSHSLTLIMGDSDKTEIPVSRSYAGDLKKITGW